MSMLIGVVLVLSSVRRRCVCVCARARACVCVCVSAVPVSEVFCRSARRPCWCGVGLVARADCFMPDASVGRALRAAKA